MNRIFNPLGVIAINAWHRLMRALYLKYGARSGPNSLDALDMVCVVHGPAALQKGSWVERLMGEVGGLSNAPVFFCFFNEYDDLKLLNRFLLLLVDDDISELVLQNPTLLRGGPHRIVVVGGGARDIGAPVEDEKKQIGWVHEPPAKGGPAWLQQFS